MSAEDKGGRGWGSRLDGLIKRVGDEVGGERGERVRSRLTEAKSRVEAGLESDEARRIRGEMATLGDKAMHRVDDALRHERTQTVVKRVNAALNQIGDRLYSEQTERRPDAHTASTDQNAAESDQTVPTRDARLHADEASAASPTDTADGTRTDRPSSSN